MTTFHLLLLLGLVMQIYSIRIHLKDTIDAPSVVKVQFATTMQPFERNFSSGGSWTLHNNVSELRIVPSFARSDATSATASKMVDKENLNYSVSPCLMLGFAEIGGFTILVIITTVIFLSSGPAAMESTVQEKIVRKDPHGSSMSVAPTASYLRLKQNVRHVIETAIQAPSDILADDDDLTDLGITSVQFAMIHSQLSSITGMRLPRSALSEMLKIADITNFLWHELSKHSERLVVQQSASNSNLQSSQEHHDALTGLHAVLMVVIFLEHSNMTANGAIKECQLTMQLMYVLAGILSTHSLPAVCDKTHIFRFYLQRCKSLHIPYLFAVAISFSSWGIFTGGQFNQVFSVPCDSDPKTTWGLTFVSYLLGLGGAFNGFIFQVAPTMWYSASLYVFTILSPWFYQGVKKWDLDTFHIAIICAMVSGIRFLLKSSLIFRFAPDALLGYCFTPQWVLLAFLGLLVSASWKERHMALVRGWKTDFCAISLLLWVIMVTFSKYNGTAQLFSDFGLWLGLPLLVLFAKGVDEGQGVTSTILGLPLLVKIGGLTYHVYLFHWPILCIWTMHHLDVVAPAPFGPLAWRYLLWYEALCAYIVTIIISAILQQFGAVLSLQSKR